MLMADYIFKQLTFARKMTLKIVDGVTENDAVIIPDKFNNNMKWNLGHIYTVQERLVFKLAGEPVLLPDGYQEWFGNGSKPSDWKGYTPEINDLKPLLLNQTSRIIETFEQRISEKVASPYTTSSGLTLETIGELLTFSMYHEGMHFDHIKTYKRLLNL